MRTSLVLVAALAAAGCLDQADSTGSVAVALPATDASGATYRLTPGARLVMASGTFFDELPLDGDGVVRLDVPAGDYTAELVHDDGHTVQWPLERTDLDGTTETVIATLVTPMPALLTVIADAQTNLALQFQVPGFGPVTFDQGTVEVSIEVAETTAGGVVVEGSGAFTTTTLTTHPSAPPVLLSRLPALGDASDVTIGATLTGDWFQASSTAACAPAIFHVAGSSQPGLADLIAESNDAASTNLCVFAGSPTVQILGLRVGAATTATFSDLGEPEWLFISSLTAELPAPVFDGETLDLGPAVGTFTVPATVFTRATVRRPGQPSENWYRAFHTTETASLQLVLTP
jgi:hypothetical protein